MSTKKKQRLQRVNAPPKFTTVAEYEALSEADKDKLQEYYHRKIPKSETRPLTPDERNQFERARRKVGRPRLGAGAKVVAVTLEKGFLAEVDAYARRHDLKRSEMIVRGLRSVMKEAS